MALFTYPPVSIDTAGLATEATLLQVESNTADTVTELQSANTTLTSIDGTLSNVEAEVQTAVASLAVIESTVSTEVTAAASLSELQTLNSNDFATEPTLQNVLGDVQNILAEVTAVNSRVAGSLTPVEHDELVITYVLAGNGQGEISTVTYKLATVTVAVLTMSYDANDRLVGVVRT